MTTQQFYLKKNKYFIMLFSVLLLFTVSYYLYISKLDIAIHDAVILWGKPYGIQHMWGLISRIGEDGIQAIICVFFGIFYYLKCDYRLSRLWYGSIIVYLMSGIFIQLIKFTVGRPRPKLLPEYDPAWFETAARMHSWPSGHTTTTFALLACLLPFYTRKIQIILIFIAMSIGFSRVGLGSHYMSDVLSGAVLGYVIGALLREKFKLGEKI